MFLGIGDVVFPDGRQVVIDMSAVFVAERFTSAEDGGKVGVAVAMTVGHAASPEDLGGVEEGESVLFVKFELVEEVAELIDEEGVGCGEAAKLFGVAVVMA